MTNLHFSLIFKWRSVVILSCFAMKCNTLCKIKSNRLISRDIHYQYLSMHTRDSDDMLLCVEYFSIYRWTSEYPAAEYDDKELMWILRESKLFQKFFNWKLFIDGTSCAFLLFIQIKVLIDSFILKSTIIIKNYEGSTGINSKYLYFKPKLQQYLKRGFSHLSSRGSCVHA